MPAAKTMIRKNLARRLERLEAEIMPAEEKIVVLDIRFVRPDGQVASSQEFKVHIPVQPPKRRFR